MKLESTFVNRTAGAAALALAAGTLLVSIGAAVQAAPPPPVSQPLVINAAVAATCTISLASPTTGATVSAGTATLTLPSNSAGTTSIGLVAITENCNDKNGYTLTVTDTGSGTLTGSAGNTDTLTYTITYDPTGTNKTVTPSTSSQLLFTAPKKASATKQVSAAITNPGFATADTYTDTLTFTMTPQ